MKPCQTYNKIKTHPSEQKRTKLCRCTARRCKSIKNHYCEICAVDWARHPKGACPSQQIRTEPTSKCPLQQLITQAAICGNSNGIRLATALSKRKPQIPKLHTIFAENSAPFLEGYGNRNRTAIEKQIERAITQTTSPIILVVAPYILDLVDAPVEKHKIWIEAATNSVHRLTKLAGEHNKVIIELNIEIGTNTTTRNGKFPPKLAALIQKTQNRRPVINHAVGKLATVEDRWTWSSGSHQARIVTPTITDGSGLHDTANAAHLNARGYNVVIDYIEAIADSWF